MCEPLYPSPPPPAPIYSSGDVSLDGVLDIGDVVLMACGAKQESGNQEEKSPKKNTSVIVNAKRLIEKVDAVLVVVYSPPKSFLDRQPHIRFDSTHIDQSIMRK